MCNDFTPASLHQRLHDQLASFDVRVPEPAAADHQPHALHRLERLRHPAAGRARARHSPRHQLLLLAWRAGSTIVPASSPDRACRCVSPRPTARLIDVYQATDADDRRVGPDLSIHHRHAARPGAWVLRATMASFVANMHTDLADSSQAPMQSSPRPRRAACRSCRPSRCSTGWTAAMRPPSRRSAGTGRCSASLSLRQRPPADCRRMVPAAGRTVVAREPDQGQRADRLHDSAGQGHQLRDVLVVVWLVCRAVHRRQHAAGDLGRHGHVRPRRAPPSRGRRARSLPPAWYTAPARAR